MEYKRFDDVLVVRVDKGEELVQTIQSIIEKEDIKLGYVTGIGATDNACVGMLDLRQNVYTDNSFMEPMEITSILGNITSMKGRPYLHLHVTLSNSEGKAYGGHLAKAFISVTAEVFIHIVKGSVERENNKDLEMNLLKF